MASRPKGFGMTAELANKQAAKFNSEVATQVMTWIKEVLEHGGENEAAGNLPIVSLSYSSIISSHKYFLRNQLKRMLQPTATKKPYVLEAWK